MRWSRAQVWWALAGFGSLLAAVGVFLAGWTVVRPGEVVVVRRLGRQLPRAWGPGPHWAWPAGIDRVVRVRTDEVRRLTVGRSGTPGADEPPELGEYLTGDWNLVRAEATVQFRVSDPVAFVLRSRESDALLARRAEGSLARALARRGIDAALRADRAAVAREVAADLAGASARYGLGLEVLGVSLTEVRPPIEVQPDFDAAQAARSEQRRRISEAKTAAAQLLPAARAEAAGRTDRARAEADRAVTLARSRAGRFLALLTEARRSRPLTIRRLYLDALRDLLPRIRRKLVLTPDEPVDLSILGAAP